MSRIDEVFARLRNERRRALIPYFCAGDPSLETTARLIEEAAGRGADLIEIGLPFPTPSRTGRRSSGRARGPSRAA